MSILCSLLCLLAPATPTLWHGYPVRPFTVAGVNGYVVVPQKPAPGRPWLWRARFPDYHPEAAAALLDQGFHVAYFDLPNIFGSPRAVAAWDQFYQQVTTSLGLSPRVALEAVSRGGLFVYNWAIRNPGKVSCVYGESPVCDMKSWPGGRGKGIGSPKDWQQALDSYGFTEEQMLAFHGNPIDYAADLARHRIPILHVVCDEDQVVPPAENTEIFARRYRAAGGPIEVYYNQTRPTSDHGHHFTLDSIRKEVDFVLRAR